jgi:hypothetical protein
MCWRPVNVSVYAVEDLIVADPSEVRVIVADFAVARRATRPKYPTLLIDVIVGVVGFEQRY